LLFYANYLAIALFVDPVSIRPHRCLHTSCSPAQLCSACPGANREQFTGIDS